MYTNPHYSFQSNEAAETKLSDFATIEQLCSEYPWIVENRLRWLLRYRHENGLGQHVSKFGKSLLISRSGFAQWLHERQG